MAFPREPIWFGIVYRICVKLTVADFNSSNVFRQLLWHPNGHYGVNPTEAALQVNA